MKNQTAKGFIVILGSANSDTGELLCVAKSRTERALLEYHRNPGFKFLLTGGFGNHFNITEKPHAYYVKQYLISRSVPEEDFVEFAESSNTIEDAALSRPIVLNHGVKELIVSTSDFHVERARFIFEREFKDTGVNITFSPCKTDESQCNIDLEARMQHEKNALERLRKSPDNLAYSE